MSHRHVRRFVEFQFPENRTAFVDASENSVYQHVRVMVFRLKPRKEIVNDRRGTLRLHLVTQRLVRIQAGNPCMPC